MNYTDKEIEIIKRIAYDKGRAEGVAITLIVCAIGLFLSLYLIKP